MSCPSRCRSRIRRSGSRPRAARPSTKPHAMASGHLPSRSSIPPKPSNGWVNITTSSKPENGVRIGNSVNANIGLVGGSSCHADPDEARRRGLDGFRFFGYALGHHYIFGEHLPGRTNIWANYEQARDLLPIAHGGAGAIGSPEPIEQHLPPVRHARPHPIPFLPPTRT